MSATGRGGARVADDNYPTPPWCTRRLLEGVSLPGGLYLEPAAGDGAIIREAQRLRSDISWSAVELREVCREPLGRIVHPQAVVIGDFVALGKAWATHLPAGQKPYTGVVTNPPYALAEQFVEVSLKIAHVVVMLLRINFLGSERRYELLRQHPPDVYVLPNRPCFVDGRSDATEYAWFVWGAGRGGHLSILPLTSAEERRTATSAPRLPPPLSLQPMPATPGGSVVQPPQHQ